MINISRFCEFGRKIIGVGRNYKMHAKELGNEIPSQPVIFLKPTTSYIQAGQDIQLPSDTKEIHHEVELGVVIGDTAKGVSESDAMDYVAGYTLALDMTNRIAQNHAKTKGLPWSLAKGFDTSCPISEFVEKSSVPDPHALHLWLKVNGESRQDGNTSDMMFSVPFLVSWISQHFTLERGDVILTGTPAGVGPVVSGDVIECGLDSLVKMKFDVK